MGFELFVALRYLRAKRKGLFTVVTTLIGIAGVSIGVAALIVILSVMNGFQADIQKKIVGAQAHITVLARMTPEKLQRLKTELDKHPEITARAPFALGQAILTYDQRSTGMVLKGIEPAKEFAVNDLAKSLTRGTWEGLGEGKPKGIVLGEELARSMGLWLDDEVIIMSPQGLSTALGMIPAMKKFRVKGLLKTGYYEYDSAMAYTSREAAADLFRIPQGITGVQLRAKKLGLADAVAAKLRHGLGFDFTVRSFSQMNRTLFAALKLEKCVMFIIVTLIVLVASFNIASNLILMGTEKLRDVGLLRAMGATRREILRIFLFAGALIGVLGVLLGSGLGLAICWFIRRYPIIELPGDIYYLSRLPVSVQPTDVAIIVSSGLVLAVLAAVYPAVKCSKVDPIEAIHYG